MLHTFNHLKSLVKDTVKVVKDASIGTLSAIKTDIVKFNTDVKNFREFVKTQDAKASEESKD